MQQLAVASAVVFLMILPFGHLVALRSLSLVVALAATALLWLRGGPRYVPLLSVFATWLLAACLSLLATSDMDNSLRDISGEIVRSFLVFFVFYTLARRCVPFRVWALASCAAAIGVSLVAVAAFLFYGEWTIDRVPTLGDFATSAITLLPMLGAYAAFAPNGRGRALAGLAVAALLGAAYLTFSRSVWAVVMTMVAIALLLYPFRSRSAAKRALAILLILAAGALAVALAVSNERDRSLLYSADRTPIYVAVAKKIVHNPWTGTGYGHETDKDWYAAALPGASVFHAHNIVLSFVDQMGIFGAFALAMIFGMPALLFLRRLRGPREQAVPPALAGIVLLVAVFVKNGFDYFFVNQNLWLFFAYLGIFLGDIQRIEGGRSPVDAAS